MHYYQFNIADYRKDTTHLSMLEHGAYRQLLDWHYIEQAPIPLETEVVFRRLSARTEDERLAIEIVLKELFIRTENGYIQHRVMREIGLYEAKADRARQAGKLGGRPKKTEVVISRLSNETEEKANSLTNKLNNSITNNKKHTRTSALDDGFNEFWNAYPKKNSKGRAEQAWKKHKPNIDLVMKALAWQIESDKWQEKDGKFIPYPASYINAQAWLDEPQKERMPF